MMKKNIKVGQLFIRYLIILAVFIYSYRTFADVNNFSYSKEDYLAAAVKAANWLISLEQEEVNCGGLSWPFSTVDGSSSPGRCNGAAGVGLFFIKRYQATGNISYLEKAKRAGEFIWYYHRSVYMMGPDWFDGAASGGDYFLNLYKVTNDRVHLDRAKYFADWLFQDKQVDGDGYYWIRFPDAPDRLYTGIAHGAAGIGLFFLDLYELSQDAQYLDYAERAFNWMSQHIVRFDDTAIGWKRLTWDDFAYHLWCGGSTGILFFLEELYRVTGKEIYRDYLEQTANGLVKYAVQAGGGCAWHYTSTSSYAEAFSTIYCHGASSTVHALYSANTILQDSGYLDCARSGAAWLMEQKKSSNPTSFYWTYFSTNDWVNTGLLDGVASVGYAFVKYFDYDQNPEYLDVAQGAANWLLDVAEVPTTDQMRWVNFTSAHSNWDEKAYLTGWYHGTAGIGIFLLELYEALNSTGLSNQEGKNVPEAFFTLSNYPNPFNAFTRIVFNIPHTANVTVEIYNMFGRTVIHLIEDRPYPAGRHEVLWDAKDDSGKAVASGIYSIRLRANKHVVSKKVVLTE